MGERRERAAVHGYLDGAFPDPGKEGRMIGIDTYRNSLVCYMYYIGGFNRGVDDRIYRRERFGFY